jgi:predicted Zn-dependent protease
MNNVGELFLALNRVKDAAKIFKMNADAYPNSALVHLSLAKAYSQAGERELAIRSYKRVLSLHPGNAVAHAKLKTLKGNGFPPR